MNIVQAVQVLFAQTAPAGADFESAFNALKGKKEADLSNADATTLDALAETFQDFVGDPTGWLKKASAADPRHSWWVQLAQALGASVTSGPAPATATPMSSPGPAASTAPADPLVPDIEPEQGIDPDVLAGGAPAPGRREGGGTGGGGVVVNSGDDDRRREPRERKPPEPPPAPKPLIDVTSREIPAITREILAHGSYRSWSAILIEAFRLIRTGSPTEQAQKRAEIPYAHRLIEAMKVSNDRMEVQTGFHLERLLEVLESGRDQREPAWFQANYVTGTYA